MAVPDEDILAGQVQTQSQSLGPGKLDFQILDKILKSAAVGERVRLTSVNTDGLELEYVWMIEFLHELYFFHLVGSIGLLFVHFHHHYVASPQVANFKHLAEEAGPELLALEVIQPVEVSEGPLESLAGGGPAPERGHPGTG